MDTVLQLAQTSHDMGRYWVRLLFIRPDIGHHHLKGQNSGRALLASIALRIHADRP